MTDHDLTAIRDHFAEAQMLEIVLTVSVFGFLNRFNDTMGTPLEDVPAATGQKYLGDDGWSPGKHAR